MATFADVSHYEATSYRRLPSQETEQFQQMLKNYVYAQVKRTSYQKSMQVSFNHDHNHSPTLTKWLLL